MNDVMDSVLDSATVITRSEMEGESVTEIEADDPLNPMMRSFFRVEGVPSKKDTENMNEIYEWAKEEAGSEDNFDIVKVLRDVKLKLGTTPIDKSYLSHFYQYVKLARQSQKLKGEMEALVA